MKYTKSATPYLIVLCLIVIGIPLLNYQIEQNQSIQIEIKKESAKEQPKPLAIN